MSEPLPGVTWVKAEQVWRVRAGGHGVHYLGRYTRLEDANAAKAAWDAKNTKDAIATKERHRAWVEAERQAKAEEREQEAERRRQLRADIKARREANKDTAQRIADLLADSDLFGDMPPLGEMEGALCAQTDPDQWHQDTTDNIEAAKRLCHTCPAFEACRQWGIDHPYEHGVWGGLSPRQRLRLNLQQRKEQAS